MQASLRGGMQGGGQTWSAFYLTERHAVFLPDRHTFHSALHASTSFAANLALALWEAGIKRKDANQGTSPY